MRSGWFIAGGFNDVGTTGFYWSSTADDAANSHYLLFASSWVNPAASNPKFGGLSVRCVAPLALKQMVAMTWLSQILPLFPAVYA